MDGEEWKKVSFGKNLHQKRLPSAKLIVEARSMENQWSYFGRNDEITQVLTPGAHAPSIVG